MKMKTFIVKIMALSMISMFFLSGCRSKEAKAVEEMITAIGVVTEDSGDAINEAEQAYNALPASDQQSVRNYNTLLSAKETYKTLPTKLTLDNYSKYLNINFNVYADGMPDGAIGFSKVVPISSTYTAWMLYGGLNCSAYSEGTSTNYDYNDVVITGTIKGTYRAVKALGNDTLPKEYDYEVPFEITTDISGKGRSENVYYNIYKNRLITVDEWVTKEIVIESIEGTVESTK